MKIKIIGGDFGHAPRASGYVNQLHYNLKGLGSLINGGTYEDLEYHANSLKYVDVLIWMPNIDNSYPKIVDSIKKKYPNLILVQSKFNNGKYTDIDLVARALKSKANLLIEFTENIIMENGNCKKLFNSKIIDPLGNIFYNNINIEEMANALQSRLEELINFTRMGSTCVIKDKAVPNDEEFFKIVEGYGHKYHELIHAVNQDRFLGNCSFRQYNFRCSYGFPSYRGEGTIFVSKRNLDKRKITQESFVPVRLSEDNTIIEYCGDHKPSVDTPIQVELYDRLPLINYMIHSHVFIKDAPFTNSIVPCGALEEVDEIMSMIENPECLLRAMINLKGHGSIIMSNSIEYLRDIPYYKE